MKKTILIFLLVLLVGGMFLFITKPTINQEESTIYPKVYMVDGIKVLKDYDSLKKEVILKDYENNTILTSQLNTAYDNKVGAGYQKVAQFTINSEQDKDNVLSSLELYDKKKNDVLIERQIDVKYLTIKQVEKDVYGKGDCFLEVNGSETCPWVVVGTQLIDEEVWLDFNNSIKSKEEIVIGLFTDVQIGDKVEWIPTLLGVKIDEWAVWTQSLNVGLQVYYKLDSAPANLAPVNDSTGHQNGTNIGAVNTSGIINSALNFSTDYVTIADNASLENTNAWSASFWMNADSLSASSILDKGNAISSFNFRWQAVTSLFVCIDNQCAGDTSFTATDTWKHIVGTYDGAFVRLYVDGVNKDNHSDASGMTQDGNNVSIGSLVGGGSAFDGAIDEVGIWNRTLSVGEIQNLYNNGLGISWADVFGSPPIVTPNAPINAFNSTTSLVTLNVTITDNVEVSDVKLFINGELNNTNTSLLNGTYIYPINFADGNFNWSVGATDDEGTTTNMTARNFTVDTILPDINLSSPTGQIDSHAIGDALTLNWSVEDANLDSCWFNYNGTNTTLTCGNNGTTFNTVEGEQNLTFYANDTVGNENSEVTSWTYAFLETGVSFNLNVTETSTQTFAINVTTDITILSITAILTYDGANDTSTASCDEGNCTISNTIDVSLVSTGATELHDFFWNLVIFNGTSSTSIITSTRQQNVTRLHLELCNATFTNQSLNFTVHDERTLTRIVNFAFDGDLDFWTGGGTVKRNNSISNVSSETTLCLTPENETMNLDAIIDYDEETGTQYTSRFYYFDSHEISNTSQDIFMYLLNSSFSTSFILKVQDDSLLPVANALIEIHRFYPGTGEFRIVQIARTDDNGNSIGFFETEIVDYKFIIKRDGEILLETGQQKVVPETSPFTLTFNIGEPLGEPWSSQQDIDDLNSSLGWDDTTGIVTYTYIDSSSNFTLARLMVVQESLVNSSADSTICNENSTLTSASLTCVVGSTNGFYVASSFITRNSVETLDLQFTFQIETLSGVVGLLGLFFGWFLVLIASFMFKFNEIAGIWAITITVFLVNLFGLISFGGVFVTATIAIAVILTWIMEK